MPPRAVALQPIVCCRTLSGKPYKWIPVTWAIGAVLHLGQTLRFAVVSGGVADSNRNCRVSVLTLSCADTENFMSKSCSGVPDSMPVVGSNASPLPERSVLTDHVTAPLLPAALNV